MEREGAGEGTMGERAQSVSVHRETPGWAGVSGICDSKFFMCNRFSL